MTEYKLVVVGGKCTGNINKNVYCLFLFIFKRVASEKVHWLYSSFKISMHRF